MTAEVEANNVVVDTTTKSDSNMFKKVKERLSGRKKNGTKVDDNTSLENVSLSEKELEGGEEKRLIDVKDETGEKTTAIEKVKDFLKGSSQNGSLTNDITEENKKLSTLQRVKERLSLRRVKKPNTAGTENTEESKNLPKEDSAEEVDKDQENHDGNSVEKKKKTNTIERMKERLSTRKKKKVKEEAKASDIEPEDVTKIEEQSELEVEATNKSTDIEEAKRESFIQRLLKLFRSKKKRNSYLDDGEEENKEKDLSEEDKEILEICGTDNDSDDATVPKITTTKPPLPGGRRLPSSATTAHTRPISQLDDALKQFKLSTAASRENLRNSRQDLNQMEEHVKVMIRSRPATPLLSLRTSEDHGNKMTSSSMTDLRS